MNENKDHSCLSRSRRRTRTSAPRRESPSPPRPRRYEVDSDGDVSQPCKRKRRDSPESNLDGLTRSKASHTESLINAILANFKLSSLPDPVKLVETTEDSLANNNSSWMEAAKGPNGPVSSKFRLSTLLGEAPRQAPR